LVYLVFVDQKEQEKKKVFLTNSKQFAGTTYIYTLPTRRDVDKTAHEAIGRHEEQNAKERVEIGFASCV
jgi:hypothetical protein